MGGSYTGFLDTFKRLGGVKAFGYPKTEARRDTGASGTLLAPGSSPGIIRQYFQAAVLESFPAAVQPVKLTLLGDVVRNRINPNNGYESISAFRRATPFTPGQATQFDRATVRAPKERTPEAVVRFVQPSLVRVQRASGGCGSGFFVDARGHAVTNWHVVDGETRFTVRMHDGRDARATVVASDEYHDIALLRVEGVTSTPVEWGLSDGLNIAAQLVALGFPAPLRESTCPLTPKVTVGVLSARTTIDGLTYLQTDLSLNPGNSGGPVAALNGTIVWISKAEAIGLQNTNFLIPEERAHPIITSWLRTLGSGQPPSARSRPGPR
ncbi:MAG: serine protease [Actinobacteria bacterium]|nr:serine protease [Actinomycetota bacterium]